MELLTLIGVDRGSGTVIRGGMVGVASCKVLNSPHSVMHTLMCCCKLRYIRVGIHDNLQVVTIGFSQLVVAVEVELRSYQTACSANRRD